MLSGNAIQSNSFDAYKRDLTWELSSFQKNSASSDCASEMGGAPVTIKNEGNSHLQPCFVKSVSNNRCVNSDSGTFKFKYIETSLHVACNHLHSKKSKESVFQNICGVTQHFHIATLMRPSDAGENIWLIDFSDADCLTRTLPLYPSLLSLHASVKRTIFSLLRDQAHYAHAAKCTHVDGNSAFASYFAVIYSWLCALIWAAVLCCLDMILQSITPSSTRACSSGIRRPSRVVLHGSPRPASTTVSPRWASFSSIALLVLMVGSSATPPGSYEELARSPMIEAPSCNGSISLSEYNSLYDLYNSTDGENWAWTATAGVWSFPAVPAVSAPCADTGWQGLTCISTVGVICSIVDIELAGYALRGSLPSSLAQLPQLQNLVLFSNFLTGTIPSSIGKLPKLQRLYLYSNSLTGSIPSTVGQLSMLVDLSLNSNDLTQTIPTSLGQLSQLQILELYSNFLTGTIPATLGQLSQLLDLVLITNSLTGTIPSSLGQLSQLVDLWLYSNWLTGTIPSSLGQLPHLVNLGLFSNSLSGAIPSSLGQLSHLVSLDMYTNFLTGSMPSSFGQLSGLQGQLGLCSNFLTGTVPSSLGQLSQLELLNVYENYFTGTIPSSLGLMSHLTDLGLFSTYLTGTIPSSLGLLLQLEYMNLDSNSLSGTIPPSVGQLSQLENLWLYSNSLSGSIPSSLGQLLQLEDLWLYSNYLTGTIPSSLGQLAKMQYLELFSNSLTGPLPSSLTNLSELLMLDLTSNWLSGSIPCFNHTATSLQEAFLSQNLFSGSISGSFDCIPNTLQTLDLEGNKLSGDILWTTNAFSVTELILAQNFFSRSMPSNFGALSNLKLLLLEYNLLTGSPNIAINPSVQLNLSAIDLSFNDFSGPVPSTVFQLPSLESFAAVESCYSGPLPLSICEATLLEVLLLDGITSGQSCRSYISISPQSVAYYSKQGYISGGIPSCLWSMPALKVLHLSSNGLTGTIGPIVSSVNLIDIDLSHNALVGTIPVSLQTLPFATLDLSNNMLKGTYSENVKNHSADISLSSNRLSGFLPSSSFNDVVGTVDVMQGNLFNCDSEHPAPFTDAYSSSTVCGSDDFNYSIWAACAVFVSLLVIVIVIVSFWIRRKSAVICEATAAYLTRIHTTATDRMHDIVDVLLSAFRGQNNQLGTNRLFKRHMSSTSTTAHPHALFAFVSYLQRCVRLSVVFCVLSLLVSFPMYPLLKTQTNFSTHTFQLGWVVSGVFLSGVTPAVLILVVWYCCVLFFCSSISSQFTEVMTAPASDRGEDSRESKYTVLCYRALVGVQFSVILAANVGYVYVIVFTHLSINLRILLQIALGIFKFVVNNLAIDAISKNEIVGSRHSLWYRFCLLAFNNVLAPLLVSLASDNSCLVDLFVPVSSIEENFDYQLASRKECVNTTSFVHNTGSSTFPVPPPPELCYTFSSPVSVIDEFYPAFTYSYQCGSAVIRNYVPVLIYTYALQTFIVPLCVGAAYLYFLSVDGDRSCGATCERGQGDEKRGGEGSEDEKRGGEGSEVEKRGGEGSGVGWLHRPRVLLFMLFDSVIRGIFRPLSGTVKGDKLLSTPAVIARSAQIFLVLLTFGLASPPLAVIVTMGAAVDFFSTLLYMDLYLQLSPQCSRQGTFSPNSAVSRETQLESVSSGDLTGGLEAACVELAEAPRLLLWVIVVLSAVFWSLILFDMVGTTNPNAPLHAVWAPVVTVSLAIVIPTAVGVRSIVYRWLMTQGDPTTRTPSSTETELRSDVSPRKGDGVDGDVELSFDNSYRDSFAQFHGSVTSPIERRTLAHARESTLSIQLSSVQARARESTVRSQLSSLHERPPLISNPILSKSAAPATQSQSDVPSAGLSVAI